MTSINPATLEKLGEVRIASSDEVTTAVTQARQAFPDWASRSFKQRAEYILSARRFTLDHLDEIVDLISRETGKPKTEVLAIDIIPAVDVMSYSAKKTAKLLKPERIGIGKYNLLGRASSLHFKPLGVVGIISPWNVPFGIPMSQLAMALMAGNTVVLKPSEYTPMIGLKLGEIFRAVGLPDGVLTVVPGDGSTGAALVEAGANKIIFTGSVATGKKVAAAAAKDLIPVVLELGGKDAMIVLKDADIEAAASGAVWGAFCNAGQVCASVERCYVDETIADEFIARVVEKTKKLRQGAGENQNVDIGAMTNEQQLRIVDDQVSDATRRGAKILCGGERNREMDGLFYKPTVLVNLDHTFPVMQAETFGPVLPIMTFKTVEEAVRLANDSRYGLTASIWTRNIALGKRLATQLQAGTAMINESVYTYAIPETPWGGVKQSGLGHTHAQLGLKELVQTEHIHVNRITWLKDFWWYGYSAEAYLVLADLARYFTSPSLREKLKAIGPLLRGLRLKKY